MLQARIYSQDRKEHDPVHSAGADNCAVFEILEGEELDRGEIFLPDNKSSQKDAA